MKTISLPLAIPIVIILAGLSVAWGQHDHHNAGGYGVAGTIKTIAFSFAFQTRYVSTRWPTCAIICLRCRKYSYTLGMGHNDIAAKIAESRLGMSSLSLHGAAEVAKYMPQGMQDAGTAMHRAASRLTMAAQDSEVYR